jgi:hypothetical protein
MTIRELITRRRPNVSRVIGVAAKNSMVKAGSEFLMDRKYRKFIILTIFTMASVSFVPFKSEDLTEKKEPFIKIETDKPSYLSGEEIFLDVRVINSYDGDCEIFNQLFGGVSAEYLVKDGEGNLLAYKGSRYKIRVDYNYEQPVMSKGYLGRVFQLNGEELHYDLPKGSYSIQVNFIKPLKCASYDGKREQTFEKLQSNVVRIEVK